jgi:ribose transport system permease protein
MRLPRLRGRPVASRAEPTPAGPGGGTGTAARRAEQEERILGLGDLFGRNAGAIVVLVVLFGALTLASDEFLTAANLANLAR